jgi:hypothetical protein
MAQKWLDLSELAADDVWTSSLRRCAIQSALGAALKTVSELPITCRPIFWRYWLS